MDIRVQHRALEDIAIGILRSLPPKSMVEILIAEAGLAPQGDVPRLRSAQREVFQRVPQICPLCGITQDAVVFLKA
jgi:hypothetical protein